MTYPRGIAYREAGHAVVGWALGLRVTVTRVFHDDAKGWKGGTDANVAQVGQLPLPERLAFFAAGYIAETMFQCPIPTTARLTMTTRRFIGRSWTRELPKRTTEPKSLKAKMSLANT